MIEKESRNAIYFHKSMIPCYFVAIKLSISKVITQQCDFFFLYIYYKWKRKNESG